MIKRSVLIISSLLFVAPVMAQTDYQHCFKDGSSEVCKAFLAGIKTAKPDTLEQDDTKEQKSSLLSRALEQRAGGHYKTTTISSKG